MTHVFTTTVDQNWPRRLVLIGLALSLTACATYRPPEAECFNGFAEVSRSNCTFELLTPMGPAGG